MGCSKNYIMYWGFYESNYSINFQISVHKLHKKGVLFLCKLLQLHMKYLSLCISRE